MLCSLANSIRFPSCDRIAGDSTIYRWRSTFCLLCFRPDRHWCNGHVYMKIASVQRVLKSCLHHTLLTFCSSVVAQSIQFPDKKDWASVLTHPSLFSPGMPTHQMPLSFSRKATVSYSVPQIPLYTWLYSSFSWDYTVLLIWLACLCLPESTHSIPEWSSRDLNTALSLAENHSHDCGLKTLSSPKASML